MHQHTTTLLALVRTTGVFEKLPVAVSQGFLQPHHSVSTWDKPDNGTHVLFDIWTNGFTLRSRYSILKQVFYERMNSIEVKA